MAEGLLRVTGTIDLKQFWPVGTSDADTTSILVTVGGDDISFRPSPGEPFQVTHVFEDVTVIGRVRKAAIRNGRITIRLQGIDACELHYCPAEAKKFKKPLTEEEEKQHALYLDWNKQYRQYFAETATVRLHGMLAGFGEDPLPCLVVTAVDEPGQVFDVYGRMVGDILVGTGNEEVNVNRWLVECGYALPALYNCMSNDEIIALLTSARIARDKHRGLWNGIYTPSVTAFDWDLVCRKKGSAFDPEADRGQAIMPKLFRRQAAYEVNRRALEVSGTFKKYLKSGKDDLYKVGDFLENGKNAKNISLDSIVAYNRVKMEPEQIVFKEDTGVTLKKPDNAPVVWW